MDFIEEQKEGGEKEEEENPYNVKEDNPYILSL